MSSSPQPRPLPSVPSFTGASIDRASELRTDPDRIAALASDPAALAVAGGAGDVLVEAGGDRLARLPWRGDPETAVLLGLERGRPLFALDAGTLDGTTAGSVRTLSLREAGTALAGEESGLAAYLVAVLNWHRKHRFCSVCGTATRIQEAGLSRHCPNCGATHFPRTDPVVIMTVEYDGRLLLGSRTGWDADRYSVLAGFVASGETPEEAVVREVEEESGIVARDARYMTSQPWPFPASLMLGFHAEADGGDPRPGGDGELSAVRWFSREEVIAMQREESPLKLPGSVSIARVLIDHWVARTAPRA